MAYNLSGVSNLKLSPATIAGIFSGKIKTWNDPAIKADNSGVSLPSTPITLAVRSDSSGTTQNFTEFLVDAAPSAWTLGSGSTIKWPSSARAGTGNPGVAQIVKSTPGAIGYVDYATAKASSLSFASVKNKDGSFVAPSAASASAAATSVTLKPDLTFAAVWQRGRQRLPDHLPVLGPGQRQAAERQRRGHAQGLPRLPARRRPEAALPDRPAPLPSSLDQQAVAQLEQDHVLSGGFRDASDSDGSAVMSAVATADPASPAGSAHPLAHRRPLGDRLFQILAASAGVLVLVILALIAISTSQQASSWFSTEGWSVFSVDWNPGTNSFGAMTYVYGTVITAVIAIILSVPVSVSIALLLTEVVSRRWAQPIVYLIDLLAVVPSVVWGLWGILVFAPWLQGIYTSIASGLKGIPVLDSLFGAPVSGASFFTAGVILAFMITPIVTSLSREVIATVPAIDREGAYALGATRWEMITGAVWPHSQGGIVGAVMLGLGRAMGETIAVALVIGASPVITSHLFAAGYSMPAVIANQFGEASGEFRSALIGLGVLLFVITIAINLVARGVVERSARRKRGA